MSKPVKEIHVTSLDGKSGAVKAVFDTGSFYTIIREDRVPSGAQIVREGAQQQFRTAAQGGKLEINGVLPMARIIIGEKIIEDSMLVSPNLAQEMLIGAKTMQSWDVSIINTNGQTDVVVKHDMRDPDITEVD